MLLQTIPLLLAFSTAAALNDCRVNDLGIQVVRLGSEWLERCRPAGTWAEASVYRLAPSTVRVELPSGLLRAAVSLRHSSPFVAVFPGSASQEALYAVAASRGDLRLCGAQRLPARQASCESAAAAEEPDEGVLRRLCLPRLRLADAQEPQARLLDGCHVLSAHGAEGTLTVDGELGQIFPVCSGAFESSVEVAEGTLLRLRCGCDYRLPSLGTSIGRRYAGCHHNATLTFAAPSLGRDGVLGSLNATQALRLGYGLRDEDTEVLLAAFADAFHRLGRFDDAQEEVLRFA